MLKNKNNAMFYTIVNAKLATAYYRNVIGKCDISNVVLLRKVVKFIEQCPLKIVKLNVEAF